MIALTSTGTISSSVVHSSGYHTSLYGLAACNICIGHNSFAATASCHEPPTTSYSIYLILDKGTLNVKINRRTRNMETARATITATNARAVAPAMSMRVIAKARRSSKVVNTNQTSMLLVYEYVQTQLDEN